MEENPYKSPQQVESQTVQQSHHRVWSRLPELMAICWIVTILLGMILPRVQSSAPKSEKQRQQIEQVDTRNTVILATAFSVSTIVTLLSIAVVLQTRVRMKLLSRPVDRRSRMKLIPYVFVVLAAVVIAVGAWVWIDTW